MSFDLTNASATFQSYVNRALKSYIDICYVIYLDDVLIYSRTVKQHWENVRRVLWALLTHRLYAKLSKCVFNRSEIFFLEFVVRKYEIEIKQSRIEIISAWFVSKSVKDILVFLEFAEFYRRFIREFFQIIASLINLTTETKKNKTRSIFH